MTSPAARTAHGVGLATLTSAGQVLDTWYPRPVLGDAGREDAAGGAGRTTGTTRLSAAEAVDALARAAARPGPAQSAAAQSDAAQPDSTPFDAAPLAGALGPDVRRGVEVVAVSTTIVDLDAAPVDTHDVYLRLHLLSHRLAAPNTLNLDGIFGLLPNVAWTSLGPVAVADLDVVQLRARAAGIPLVVFGVDKFPRMVDYVVPSGVRIADADRVRLGAHLAAGTTVMHEGFCNYNAGTLGTSMVEGRISQGVVVDDGSDVGGGASIMGTLSGGGKERVRIGPRSLIGANAGVGISLGEDCIVEAGLYVTAGTKLTLPDGSTAKARELSGKDGWLFRRNSVSGAVEAVPRRGAAWTGLNAALHSNA